MTILQQPSPELLVSPDFNLGEGGNIPTVADSDFPDQVITLKSLHFKLGVGPSGSQSLLEATTKSPEKLQLNSELILGDGNKYYIQELNTTQVKFSSGVPLITEKTNIKFPSPEISNITPEKIATFLIFKK